MKSRQILYFIASGLFVVILLLWMSGKFTSKVPSEVSEPAIQNIHGQLVTVRLVKQPLTESAVGTVQAVHETTIASKLLSRVMEMNIKAGQAVKKNDVLMRLDESDLRAKLQQAKSSVVMAEAAHNQAVLDEKKARDSHKIKCH